MRFGRLWVFASIVTSTAIAVIACGPGKDDAPPKTQAATTPSASASAAPADDPRAPSVHYLTPDGLVGLVLDRSDGKFKVRVDGEQDIIELTPEEDRHAGDLRGHYLTTPQNKHMMYLSSGGGLTFYKGRDEFVMRRDHSVDPLPAATIAGAPKKEKLAYEIYDEQLDAISVRKKFPSYTSLDASNLTKVSAALDQVDPSMVVHYTMRDPNGWLPSVRWTPNNVSGTSFGGGAWQTDDLWDRNKKGLAKYGATVKGYSEPDSQGNHLFVQKMKGYPPNLASGTPGIIWEMEGTSAVFVAFDGARYSVDCGNANVEKGQPLEMGAGPVASWPAPLQHSLVGIPEITALAKAGAIPQKTGDDLLLIDDEWNKCAQKAWTGAKPEIDKLKTTDMDASTRSNRMTALRDKWAEQVRGKCKGSTDKLEKSVLSFIETRDKERTALFEKAKAKFGKP
jgi:hypothetical protein